MVCSDKSAQQMNNPARSKNQSVLLHNILLYNLSKWVLCDIPHSHNQEGGQYYLHWDVLEK